MEVSNLSGTGFKTMVIRTFKKLSENFKSIKNIRNHKKEPFRKTTITEMNNTLEGINS